MTQTVKDTVQSEPVSTFALFVLFACGAALAALLFWQREAVAIPPIPKRDDLRPPDEWRMKAKPGDVLTAPGMRIAYWGRPAGEKNSHSYSGTVDYGTEVTKRKKPFRGVVWHYTAREPVINFVKYQHNGECGRDRCGQFGYHFYIARDGSVIQGAPLSVRTNHIKRMGHRQRTRIGAWLDGSEALGISLVGACKPKQMKDRAITSNCVGWDATPEQTASAMMLAREVNKQLGISRCAHFGHGELQNDRRDYEGTEIAQAVRRGC